MGRLHTYTQEKEMNIPENRRPTFKGFGILKLVKNTYKGIKTSCEKKEDMETAIHLKYHNPDFRRMSLIDIYHEVRGIRQ